MKRIDSINARANVNGTGKTGFHDNADLSGQDATYLTPAWCNNVQEELANVVEDSGLTLNGNDTTQLLQALKLQTKAMANAVWHVGSKHITDSTSWNPVTALVPFFGYQTSWYLWAHVPVGVSSTSSSLGDITPLADGADVLGATTRIWERLPDGAEAPSYSFTVDKTTVDEGQQLTFTLHATNIPQGTLVDWKITGVQSADISPNNLTGTFTVGANGTATLTKTIVSDKTTEGTETLRLSLVYYPNVYKNVVINDTSILNSSEIIINSSYAGTTTQDEGYYIKSSINLYDAFVSNKGRVPQANEEITFIINSNVAIVADNTSTPAIIAGNSWLTSNTLFMDVNGLVLGKGGDAQPVNNGDAGGNAIQGGNITLTVNNYNLVAGGGGAGGSTKTPNNTGGAGGAGGAPYGLGTNHPMSTGVGENGGLLTGGTGANTGSGDEFNWLHGGKGGDAGLNGQDGFENWSSDGAQTLYSGGLAGYVYQGNVVINNLGSGQTKGR